MPDSSSPARRTMPAADVTIDDELVRGLLRDQHPDLAELDLRQVAFGWDNVMYRLGDELAVRLPRRASAAALIENELRWLPLLSPRLPLPTPAPVRSGGPGLGYPYSWSICPWFGGATAGASHVDQPSAALALGELVRALHLPAPADAPLNALRGGPLESRDERTRECIAHLPRAHRTRATEVWTGALAVEPHTGPPVWLHGDLHPANLIVDDRGRLAAVIDFGDLTAGDPATDLAGGWMLLDGEHHGAFRSVAGDEADDAAWQRARGWALSIGVATFASSSDNPTMGRLAQVILGRVLVA